MKVPTIMYIKLNIALDIRKAKQYYNVISELGQASPRISNFISNTFSVTCPVIMGDDR